MHEFIVKGIETYKKVYETAYFNYVHQKKLKFAYAYIRADLFGDFLGMNEQEDRERRRLEVVGYFESRYSTEGGHYRAQALNVICNDYAFEIGLVSHCLDLIENYWKSDVERDGQIQDDVLDAALVLGLAVSRNCREAHPVGILFHVRPSYHCLAEYESTFSTIMRSLNNLTNENTWARKQLALDLYSSPADHLEERFDKSVRIEPRIVWHTMLLAKRLRNRDLHDMAIRIVEIALRITETHDLDEWLFSEDRFYANGFKDIALSDSTLEDEHRNANEVLIAVRDRLINRQTIPFQEGSYQISDWNIIWD